MVLEQGSISPAAFWPGDGGLLLCNASSLPRLPSVLSAPLGEEGQDRWKSSCLLPAQLESGLSGPSSFLTSSFLAWLVFGGKGRAEGACLLLVHLGPALGPSALGGGLWCVEKRRAPSHPFPYLSLPPPSKPLTRGAKEEHGGLM